MKTTIANSTMVSGMSGVMPPRWGLKSVGDSACYKHVAPLALGLGRSGCCRKLQRSAMFIETPSQKIEPSSVGAA